MDYDYSKVFEEAHNDCVRKQKLMEKGYKDAEDAFSSYKTKVALNEAADVLTRVAKEKGYITSDDIRLALGI